MTCPKCGVKLPDGSRNCALCGANLLSKNLDKKDASKPKKKTKGTHAGTGEEIDRSVNAVNYSEYTQKKKAGGREIGLKILFLALYLGIVVGLFFVAWYLGAAGLLIVYVAWLCTWHFTNIEWEYITESGDWDFTKVFGNGRKRVPVLSVKIKDMDFIAPYTDEYKEKYEGADKVYDFRYDENQKDDIYFATFTENGKKSLILFYCTNKTLNVFKSYNKSNTVFVDTLSR